MADATEPVDVPPTTPVETEAAPEAPASRVGVPSGEPEPLSGTDTMTAETGSLAGTSR